MAEKILITGISGMVGSVLSNLLLNAGYTLAGLSRQARSDSKITYYRWDIDNGYIDLAAFRGVYAIIHLAGASVTDGCWTKARKATIMNSRVDSTRLLFETISKLDRQKPTTFIAASATGFYGDAGDTLLDEQAKNGNDFLARVAHNWEKQTKEQAISLGMRWAILRTGVVFSNTGGAFPKLARPIKYYLGAAFGSGKQYVSWIHIADLCGIFFHLIRHKDLQGIYNAVAPEPITNQMLTNIIAKHLNRPIWLPRLPAFVLRKVLGEMADVVLLGSRVSSEKIEKTGYVFRYPTLKAALVNLLDPSTV